MVGDFKWISDEWLHLKGSHSAFIIHDVNLLERLDY